MSRVHTKRASLSEENSDHRDQPQSNEADNGRNIDAVFIGWQVLRNGGKIALYNVTAKGHPLHGSTVTDRTLREHNLWVPQSSGQEEPRRKRKDPYDGESVGRTQ